MARSRSIIYMENGHEYVGIPGLEDRHFLVYLLRGGFDIIPVIKNVGYLVTNLDEVRLPEDHISAQQEGPALADIEFLPSDPNEERFREVNTRAHEEGSSPADMKLASGTPAIADELDGLSDEESDQTSPLGFPRRFSLLSPTSVSSPLSPGSTPAVRDDSGNNPSATVRASSSYHSSEAKYLKKVQDQVEAAIKKSHARRAIPSSAAPAANVPAQPTGTMSRTPHPNVVNSGGFFSKLKKVVCGATAPASKQAKATGKRS